MAVENITFWLDVVTLALALLSLILLVKNREYEKSAFETSINVLLFALLLMVLVKTIDVLSLIENVYPGVLDAIGIGDYMGNLVSINSVILLPLFAICLLVAVIFAKDTFSKIE
ncbi:MAG: hypothetical protein Q8Q42_00290 [Nanoarchaeota archaeon]|nr:hypothetical protein [Nanoarchaeota archaeon]